MALEDDIALFERHGLLAALEHEALRLIAFAADRRSCRAGEIIARKGEPAEMAFLVESGAIAVDDEVGGAPLIAGPGALIGEKALVMPMERPATLTAREPSVLKLIKRDTMRRVLAEFPASAQAARAYLAGDLARLGARLGQVKARLDAITD